MGARWVWGRKPPVLGAGWELRGCPALPHDRKVQTGAKAKAFLGPRLRQALCVSPSPRQASHGGDTGSHARAVPTHQSRGWPLGDPWLETPQRSPITGIKDRGVQPLPPHVASRRPCRHLASPVNSPRVPPKEPPHCCPPSGRSALASSSTRPGARPSDRPEVLMVDFAGGARLGPRASVLKKRGVVCSPAPHALGLPPPPPQVLLIACLCLCLL